MGITSRVCSHTDGWAHSSGSDSAGLGHGLIVCLSNTFPGTGTTHGGPLVYEEVFLPVSARGELSRANGLCDFGMH